MVTADKRDSDKMILQKKKRFCYPCNTQEIPDMNPIKSKAHFREKPSKALEKKPIGLSAA